MKSKYAILTIPNIITLLRVCLVVVGLMFIKNEKVFLLLYLCAGTTDVLDGYLARKLHQESSLGQKLDSLADVLLFASLLFFLMVTQHTLFSKFVQVIGMVAMFKMIPVLIHVYRYREVVILHTVLNKVVGLLFFITPFIVITSFIDIYIVILILVATITIIEETLISVYSTKLDRDITSIAHIKK